MFYWPMVVSFNIFGVHDWARIPFALSAIGLACLTCAFCAWAFGRRAGLCAGLCMATSIGLFLFTRIVIPDVTLTFTIALAMWAFLRALDEEEPHPRRWAFVLAASIGTGVLLKSLIGAVFPVAAGVLYLFVTKQFFAARTWKRLRPISGFFIALLVAAPWHILATLRNPPYFSLSAQRSGPIPRLSLVLFHQRAGSAIPQLALSSRLQYGPSAVVLAPPFSLAIPVERVLPCHRPALLQTHRPRRPRAPAGDLLDRIYPGVLHVFHDAGVLLDALLSRAGLAAGLSDG